MPPSDGSQRPRPAEGGQGVRQPRLGHHREPARGPRNLDRPRRGTSGNEFIVMLIFLPRKTVSREFRRRLLNKLSNEKLYHITYKT